MTEQEIIDYLKNSTTCFGFWPKPVQEWAKRHTQENIWLQYFAEGKWFIKRDFGTVPRAVEPTVLLHDESSPDRRF